MQVIQSPTIFRNCTSTKYSWPLLFSSEVIRCSSLSQITISCIFQWYGCKIERMHQMVWWRCSNNRWFEWWSYWHFHFKRCIHVSPEISPSKGLECAWYKAIRLCSKPRFSTSYHIDCWHGSIYAWRFGYRDTNGLQILSSSSAKTRQTPE